MDLNAVYKKTQKGLDEMAQRTVLGMRERTLLVMVDGKTTAADLIARAHHMPDPQGLLAKLIDGGFIAAETGATAAPAPASAAAQTAPAPAPAPVASAAAPAVQPSIPEAVRFARRFIADTLGPNGDMLIEAIEKCKTAPELRTVMEKTRDALQAGAGRRKSEEFWAGVQPRLPAA